MSCREALTHLLFDEYSSMFVWLVGVSIIWWIFINVCLISRRRVIDYQEFMYFKFICLKWVNICYHVNGCIDKGRKNSKLTAKVLSKERCITDRMAKAALNSADKQYQRLSYICTSKSVPRFSASTCHLYD